MAIIKTTSSYAVDFATPDGRQHRLAGFSDKGATAELERAIARLCECVRAGSPPDERLTEYIRRLPERVQKRLSGWGLLGSVAFTAKSISEHIADFEQTLTARGNTGEYVGKVCNRIRKAIAACGFKNLSDMSEGANRLQRWLGTELQRTETMADGRMVRVMTAGTANHYRDALRTFAGWLVESKNLTSNPFISVEGYNTEADPGHVRRALLPEELARLIQTVENSPEGYCYLAGHDRAIIYRLAAMTGLRASEIASLSPASFDLDAKTVTVKAAFSKHRREDVQPLHDDLVEPLRVYLSGRAAQTPLWPSSWSTDAWRMLKRDLEACNPPIAYLDDAGRTADFHALRVAFITALAQTDMPVKTMMHLARHSDPRLTLKVYAKLRHGDASRELNKLPGLTPPDPCREVQEALRTGTDDQPVYPLSKSQEKRQCAVGKTSHFASLSDNCNPLAKSLQTPIFVGVEQGLTRSDTGEENWTRGDLNP